MMPVGCKRQSNPTFPSGPIPIPGWGMPGSNSKNSIAERSDSMSIATSSASSKGSSIK